MCLSMGILHMSTVQGEARKGLSIPYTLGYRAWAISGCQLINMGTMSQTWVPWKNRIHFELMVHVSSPSTNILLKQTLF